MVEAKDEIVWIDVRTAEEYSAAHVELAINIPYEIIALGVEGLGLNHTDKIYLYCRSGKRSGIAMAELGTLGFSDLTNLMTLEAAEAFYQAAAAE